MQLDYLRATNEFRNDVRTLFLQKKLPNYMLGKLLVSDEEGWKEVDRLRKILEINGIEYKNDRE